MQHFNFLGYVFVAKTLTATKNSAYLTSGCANDPRLSHGVNQNCRIPWNLPSCTLHFSKAGRSGLGRAFVLRPGQLWQGPLVQVRVDLASRRS